MKPLVTVGIPFYNSASTLAAAVSSVLSQSHRELEVIVVDDGSDDHSQAVLRRFYDDRLTVVTEEANRGLVARLNQLTALASGSLVARMDADDVCHPDRVSRQVEWMLDHPDCDVLATAAWVVDATGRVTGARHRYPLPSSPGAPLGHGLLLHPTVMARRSWMLANPYDPAYERAEDKELWARTWATGRFHRLVDPLLFYRESGRVRAASYRAGCRSDRKVLRRYGPDLEGRGPTLRRLARSYAVEAATLAAHRLHLDPALVALRRQPVQGAESEAAQALIDSLLRL